MATIKGDTQEDLKIMLGTYLMNLLSVDIEIKEISLTHSTGEVPNKEQPYFRLEAPTGESSLCISFTNLKTQQEFNNKLRGINASSK